MSSKPFKPGDTVVWFKQVPGGGYVFPVSARVLAITEKRIKIEADDEEGKVIRHVQPKSLQHHVPASQAGRKAAKKAATGKPKGSGKKARPRMKTVRDEARENRIVMEIVVDAYNSGERAMGWYYYLEGQLNFPFLARCVEEREVSPLSKGDEVEVVGMPPERECEREVFVSMPWDRRTLAVPLAQLEVIHGDDQTREAVDDWHYWVAMGYEF
jgi:hypothetical protein